jgi:CubicO group peptidase (beta-lactamase class C family)
VVPGRGGEDDLGHAVRQLTFLDRMATPGALYSYSASGATLAGYALERAGGRPYAELVRTLVLEPLGMRRSTFDLDAALGLGLATPHLHSASADAPLRVLAFQPDSIAAEPRRGLISTPADLARLAEALLNDGRVAGEAGLPAGIVAEVLRPRAVVPGGTMTAGLGVRVGEWEGRREIRLSSGGGGYGMLVRVLPDDGVAAVVQSNTDGTVLMRAPEIALRRMLGVPEPPRGSAPAPALRPLGEGVAGTIAGTYANGGEKIELVEAEGGLRLSSGGLLLDVVEVDGGALAATIADGRVALRFGWHRAADGQQYLFVENRALVREAAAP